MAQAESAWVMPKSLVFEVKIQKKASSDTRFVEVDLMNFKIKTAKKRIFEHDKKARNIDASLIRQMERSATNDKGLTLHWKTDKSVNKKGKEKVEKYTFRNAEERQKFFEAATWCMYKGKLTVRVITSSLLVSFFV